MSTEASGSQSGAAQSGAAQPASPQPGSAEALEQEIERTRHELGETVEALVAKTDVKGRAQRRAAEVASNLRRKASDITGKARGRALAVTRKAGHEARATQERVTEHAPAVARDNRTRGGIAAAALAALTLIWLTARRRRR